MEFRTASGLLFATDFTRVVHGGRGDYIEFDPSHVVMANIEVPANQAWRKTPKYRDVVFYDEYRTLQDNVMVYKQKRYVGYADYKLGMYYVALGDLRWDGELESHLDL